MYERDEHLHNERPSYTSRSGTHAIWFSAVKADGSQNDFWHAAEVAHKGTACGHLGAHGPKAAAAERTEGWQAAAQPSSGSDPADAAAASTAGWVAAPGVRCHAEGSAGDLAQLLSSAARAVVLSVKLPAAICGSERDFFKGACHGLFDLDGAPTNGRPSYTCLLYTSPSPRDS